jgi:hypothetical protein
MPRATAKPGHLTYGESLPDVRISGREAVLTVALDVDWSAEYRIRAAGGALVVVEARVFPRRPRHIPPEGLTSTAVRTLSPSRALGLFWKTTSDLRSGPVMKFLDDLSWMRGGPALDRSLLTSRPRRPTRRAVHNDLFYADIAHEYLRLCSDGEGKPIERLARANHVEPSTARDWAHEARRRELLTKGHQGRAGGQLTKKAERLLQGQGRNS